MQTSPPSIDHLPVGWQAVDAALAAGFLEQAAEIAALSLQIARSFSDTPENQRDLSVSLNKVGDAAQARGRWEDAETVYRESLQLRRDLRAQLGDTPESLTDLAISLENVAEIQQHLSHWQERHRLLGEAHSHWRRLQHVFPDITDYAQQTARLSELINSLPTE